MNQRSAGQTDLKRKGRAVALVCSVIVTAMVGVAYASVPLYRLFCQVTGFGGTTQTASVGSEIVLDRTIKIRFDANTAKIPWTFLPVEKQITLKIGENRLAFYTATNLSDETITGTATFNVTPLEAGAYFNKIDCFCFTEQVLEPGETVHMPVSFFVDPAIADDPELDDVRTITLSYTFFQSEPSDANADLAMNTPSRPAANLN